MAEVDPAERAYAALAPFYEAFTSRSQHERWLGALLELAREHGLRGRRVLDVACGTGKSFRPLLRSGYEVTGCDISAEMLAVARAGAEQPLALFQADMRCLGPCGPFDLITCLDDAVNYLLGDDDLASAFSAWRRSLAPGGLIVFDANSLATHREVFSTAHVVEREDLFLCWHGHGLRDGEPGLPGNATIEIFTRADELWARGQSRHFQRWWDTDDVRHACEAAGLELVCVRGQRLGAVIHEDPDQDADNKLVYVARISRDGREGVRS